MSPARWLGVIATILCMGALVLWLVFEFSLGDLDRGDKLASIVSMSVAIITFPLSVLATVVVLRQNRSHRASPTLSERLDRMAEALAISVRAQWEAEEQVRRVHDPVPLPTRWTNAPEQLIDHWQTIHGKPMPLDLSGTGDDIVETFDRIPSGRLVVLGRAGAGKSILTSRFALTLLASRTVPVPVIFSLGNWDPVVNSLHTWLNAQLLTTYPALGEQGSDGTTIAEQMLVTGRILPVLDGFDEISAGLRTEAINALNMGLRPGSRMLLTSRPQEYASAVHDGDVLTAAAVIRLKSLSVSDVAEYLPLTTRKSHGGRNKWGAVVEHLTAKPQSPLAQVLTTPLMVALARAMFSDTGASPASLMDLSSVAEVEKRLISGFVPAVYASAGDTHSQQPRRWLGFLASHLSQRGTYDLAWWKLVHAVPRNRFGIAAALMMTMLMWFCVCMPLVLGKWPGDSHRVWLFGSVGAILLGGAACGIVMARRHGLRPSPARVRLQIYGRTALISRDLRRGLHRWESLTWVVAWLVIGTMFGGSATMITHSANGVMIAAGVAFVAGLCVALVGASVRALGAPIDPAEVVGPIELLETDRNTGIKEGLLFGFFAATVLWLGIWSAFEPVMGMELAVVLPDGRWFPCWLAMAAGFAGMWTVSVTVWGPWLISRFLLALAGRLPWRVMSFLDDAHRRGVLRQAGGVYQFRHARLQDHLASAERSTSASPFQI